MAEQTQLAVIEGMTAVQIFGADQVETLISKIEAEVRSFVPDTSTVKGRKEIATNAHKVSKSKVALDAMGKELVSGWKSQAKAVDDERKIVRDRLDELRDEVRQPLTDWENEEAARIETERLAAIVEADHESALIEHDLWLRARKIERKEAEQKAAEEERLAKEAAEQAERDRLDNEERIVKEAREVAEKAAEEEKQAAIKAAEEAKAAEKRAILEKEIELKQAEERRVREVKEAEENAAQEAKTKEDARIAEEQRIKAEDDRRAANKAHKGRINKAILAEFSALGVSEDIGKKIITKIVKGGIANIEIKY